MSPNSQAKADQPSVRSSLERTRLAPLPASVCKSVSRFAAEFCIEHGLQDHRTAERVSRLLKAAITPRRRKGRPVSAEVRRAADMRQQGAEWKAVYEAVIPGFDGMDKYERTYRTSRLRRSVKAYLKRHEIRLGTARRPM